MAADSASCGVRIGVITGNILKRWMRFEAISLPFAPSYRINDWIKIEFRRFVAVKQSVTAARAALVCSNSERSVTYHSKKRMPAPCVSRTVVSGTLRRVERMALEIRINSAGNPADKRLPSAITSRIRTLRLTCSPEAPPF
jgi:hypothetical protein